MLFGTPIAVVVSSAKLPKRVPRRPCVYHSNPWLARDLLGEPEVLPILRNFLVLCLALVVINVNQVFHEAMLTEESGGKASKVQ
jgi:hypothetical protein